MRRICIIGDELVAGTGDPKALGWVGRVAARTQFETLTHIMPLAVPGETTTQLTVRWESECLPRFNRNDDNRLIIGIGVHDAIEGLTTARTRLNLANIMDGAVAAGARCFVIGPPPLPNVDHDVLRKLSYACSDVCARRSVPYVETFMPLVTHDQWQTDMAASPDRYPGQAGYGLLAWLVLHRGWFEWINEDERI